MHMTHARQTGDTKTKDMISILQRGRIQWGMTDVYTNPFEIRQPMLGAVEKVQIQCLILPSGTKMCQVLC